MNYYIFKILIFSTVRISCLIDPGCIDALDAAAPGYTSCVNAPAFFSLSVSAMAPIVSRQTIE